MANIASGVVITTDVVDIRALIAALKAAENRTPKELQIASKNSAEIAVRVARVLAPKGPHQGGGRVQPLATAIVSQASTTKAYIAFGGSRAIHGAVVNFGGTVPRFHSLTRTHVPRREHIYKAIAVTAPAREAQYENAVTRIISVF